MTCVVFWLPSSLLLSRGRPRLGESLADTPPYEISMRMTHSPSSVSVIIANAKPIITKSFQEVVLSIWWQEQQAFWTKIFTAAFRAFEEACFPSG